jgi:hypothetical protein
MSKTLLGIKMWGGRRYVVEVDPVQSIDGTFSEHKDVGLEVLQVAEVVINLETGEYIKNRNSGKCLADSLDMVVYRYGNARDISVDDLKKEAYALYGKK